jgi:SAM-dependent methyltransferase/tetratricopeptide (TPR) repeat protein
MNRKERRAAEKLGQGGGARRDRAGAGSVPTAQFALMFAQAVRHRQNGELAEADALCRTILTSQPEHAPSLHLRGSIALHAGRPDIAAELIGKAIALQERVAAYHDELGLALRALGRQGEAVAHLRRALALEPDSGRSHNNLGVVLLEQGQRAEANTHFAKALSITPELLESYSDVLGLMYTLNPPLQAAVERAEKDWPRRLSIEELFGPAGLAAVSGDQFFHTVLTFTSVRNLLLERFLTSVRLALLQSAVNAGAGQVAEGDLNFCCTLAKQCFINEYMFATTPQETEMIERLKQMLLAALAGNSDVAPMWLAAFGCYHGLNTLPDVSRLAERAWPGPVDALLTQQLREPAEELRLRDTIARLTPIADATSLLVKQQYEENPYPRWVVRPSRQVAMPVADYLRRRFPGATVAGQSGSDGVDILVAGSGTGQHPIAMAEQFEGARVLAIDLSLASLAYAQRKSREFGIDNISYAQADILELGSVGRTFDLIDASGVLHHLADPADGWRVLLSLLRPNGFMRIGLYSELARRDVVAAREFCAQRGYRATAQDIRTARHELMGTELKSVSRFNDFFSTSECRDLLFHVQEHRFTIPQIRGLLDEHKLRFIGFELTNPAIAAYRQRYPDDPAMKDLGRWHAFETERPETFSGMYHFWAQRT